MKHNVAIALLTLALTGMPSACGPSEEAAAPRSPDVLLAWNARVLDIAEAEDGFLTLKGLRTAAMMHAAIHDAINAIDPRYEAYVGVTAEAGGADPVATAAEAAYAVAVSQYPDQDEALAAELDRWTAGLDPETLDDSRALGAAAAGAILAAREGDGWDAQPEYQWHPTGPGVYAEFHEHSGTPEGFIFGSGWALTKPFLMDSPDQFRSAPPPAIDSDAYTAAFDEVKDVGADESETRTADQTHLALWWKEFVEKSHSRLAREWVERENLELWKAARLFALLEMSIFDGYIASFDAKFHYNHWRPYTAIRWASNDGNPDTVEDPDWNNTHGHTYAFPSYPSAHGTVCAAAMSVMADVFGDVPVTMTIRQVDSAGPFSEPLIMEPPTRSFPSFSAAAEECSLSRVYLGIHFRYDSEAGTTLGREIGTLAVGEFLEPLDSEP